MDSCEQTDLEGGQDNNTSGSDARTVRKITEDTPDTHSVMDVTEDVMEDRRVEKLPLNTRDQTPRCLSTERHELTEMLDRSTEKVLQ